jgi:hypothetical protein
MSVPSSESGPPPPPHPHPLSRKRVCPTEPKGGGHSRLRVRGWGSQFGRLEKRLSILSTLWSDLSRKREPKIVFSYLWHWSVCYSHSGPGGTGILEQTAHLNLQMKLKKLVCNRNPQQRWKSHRSKIHRLVFGFSIDSSLVSLAYGFLFQCPRFLFGNHEHFTKVLRLRFFIEILEIQRQVCILIRSLFVLNRFHNTIKIFTYKH